jgi:hypothetical protein
MVSMQEGFKNGYHLVLKGPIVLLRASENFLDRKPAGQHVCHSGPWPYITPIPKIEASHITQIGSDKFGGVVRTHC